MLTGVLNLDSGWRPRLIMLAVTLGMLISLAGGRAFGQAETENADEPGTPWWKQMLPDGEITEADDEPTDHKEALGDRYRALNLIEYEPIHEIEFEDSPSISSVVLSPDGKTAYVHLHVMAINAWEVMAAYWYHTLGVPFGVIILVCSYLMVRTLRRPQQRGEAYCRKCNYCLAGITSDRCPECGRDISARRGRAIGRTAIRRIIIPSTIIGTLVLLYIMQGWLQYKGSGLSAFGFQWWSTRLHETAANRQAQWLLGYESMANRIVAVDVATGRVRHVFTWPGYSIRPLVRSHDGRSLFVELQRRMTSRGGEVVQVDAKTGRVIHHIAVPSAGPTDEVYPIGTTADDGRLIIAVDFRSQGSTTIHAYDLACDSLTKVLDRPGDTITNSAGQDRTFHHRFFMVSRDAEAYAHTADSSRGMQSYLIELQSGMSTRFGDAMHICVYDLESDAKEVSDFDAIIWPYSNPAFSQDGGLMFATSGVSGISAMDLHHGEVVGRLDPPMTDSPHPNGIATARSISWMLVETMNDSMLVRDMQHREWIARLNHPDKVFSDMIEVSQSGHTAVIVLFELRNNEYVHALYLYDLSELVDRWQ